MRHEAEDTRGQAERLIQSRMNGLTGMRAPARAIAQAIDSSSPQHSWPPAGSIQAATTIRASTSSPENERRARNENHRHTSQQPPLANEYLGLFHRRSSASIAVPAHTTGCGISACSQAG